MAEAVIPSDGARPPVGAPTVTAVLVTYGEPPELIERALRSLLAQSTPPAEVIMVDNHPQALNSTRMVEAGLPVRAIPSDRNLGYPSACNLAAQHAAGGYLFLLNPDADAPHDCIERLVEVAEREPRAAIVGAQILLPGGKVTNAGDNPLHLTGISPAGRYGLPREHGAPRHTIVVSGAACLIRRAAFEALGRFSEGFFLYYDDADLGWRARICGYHVVFCPDITVEHAYEFDKGGHKWLWLERNRLWSVFCNYERRTLIRLAPLLIACELGLIVAAALGGWLPQKLEAYRALWRSRARLRAHRRRVQALRSVPDAELLPELATSIESPFISGPLAGLGGAACAAYARLVLRMPR